ncbi:MAG: response regulator, partial [Pseudomonadota bacterium]|nr:response regulator [Pseudomonadota bacterium]
ALVVDDDALVRQYLCDVLLMGGWEVTEASDGVEAVSLSEGRHWGVVLLDMMMPRMGGEQTLRAIRAMDPDVGVVVVSGYAAPGAVEAALAMGRCTFLAKPFRAGELLAAVTEVAGSSVTPAAG